MSLSEISPAFTTNVLDDIVKAKGGFKHLGWEFKGGFDKGDSMLSEQFRVEIEALKSEHSSETFNIYTVIKSFPKNVARRKSFRSGDFFRNEINFYQKVLTPCLKFQDEINPNIRFDEVAECLAALHDNTNDYIVLEDLGLGGFGTVSRHTGMDFNHCRLALETIGKLHALSLVYRYQRPQEFEKLLNCLEVSGS